MIVLREDQEDVRSKLRVALRTHGSVLVYAPTGFGKTVLASALIKMIEAAGKRVIFCVHRVDLITQTATTFKSFGIRFSYIASGMEHNPYCKVFIASISTLKNRLGKYKADYILVDEAHLSAASGWALVANHYKELKSKLIGLTGSPERLDGKPLGDVWDTMIMGPSVSSLIENGFLSKYRAFSPAGVDLTGVHTRAGEYVSAEISDIMSGKAVLAGAVRHWRKYAAGRRTIGFAPSVAVCEVLAEEFRANGVMAVALDGKTPQSDRIAAFKGFADRQIDIIMNCQLFCEGFDLSAQVGKPATIEAVLDYAPTQSLAKHLQKNGRGLRADGGEPHILLDLAGNFSRHGFPDDDREWSLAGRPKSKATTATEQARICPSCFASYRPAPVCPSCGLKHVIEARKLDEVEGELEEIDVKAIQRNRRVEQGKAETLDELISLATARNYKSPEKWAAHIHTARKAKQTQRKQA